MYSGNVKTFDSAGSWSFDNLNDRNVINFGADNSHHLTLTIVRVTLMCNRKVQLSQLMENLVCQRKNLSLILVKQTLKFAWLCIIMLIIVIYFLTEDKYLDLKPAKNVNFPTQFFFGIISNGISATVSREVSLNWYAYDFSVDYNSIDKSDIPKIHKYLIAKSNIN